MWRNAEKDGGTVFRRHARELLRKVQTGKGSIGQRLAVEFKTAPTKLEKAKDWFDTVALANSTRLLAAKRQLS